MWDIRGCRSFINVLITIFVNRKNECNVYYTKYHTHQQELNKLINMDTSSIPCMLPILIIPKPEKKETDEFNEQLIGKKKLYVNGVYPLHTSNIQFELFIANIKKMHFSVQMSLLFAVLSAIISIALAIIGVYHARSIISFCLLTNSLFMISKVSFDIFKAATDADIKGILPT
jgi:hypothetical protein